MQPDIADISVECRRFGTTHSDFSVAGQSRGLDWLGKEMKGNHRGHLPAFTKFENNQRNMTSVTRGNYFSMTILDSLPGK